MEKITRAALVQELYAFQGAFESIERRANTALHGTALLAGAELLHIFQNAQVAARQVGKLRERLSMEAGEPAERDG